MEGSCPKCQTRLELPASGVFRCERCGVRFEVALGPARPPTAASAATPVPDWVPTAEMDAPCASHPGNRATAVCERCGDFMCRLCTTAVEGRAYCPKCFD